MFLAAPVMRLSLYHSVAILICFTGCLGPFVSDPPYSMILGLVSSGPPQIGDVQPLYPANGRNWNDYVDADGASRLTASDSACNPVGRSGYHGCIHGGELRTAPVLNRSNCTGLSARDVLGAFQWRCLERSGAVYMVSTGLQLDRNLSDLVDFNSGAWRPNAVIVSADGFESTTASSQWWQNPIVLDPTPGSLAVSGAVYLLTASPGGNFSLDADRIAFVGRPRILLAGAGNYIQSSGRVYLWIEGDFKLNANSDKALYLDGVGNSMFRNIGFQGNNAGSPTFADGIEMIGVNNCFFLSIRGAGFGDPGFRIDSSASNTFHRVYRTNGYLGLSFYSGATSYNNVFIDYLSVGMVYNAIAMTAGNEGHFFQSGLSANTSGGNGLAILGRATAQGHVGAVHTGGGFSGLETRYNPSARSTIADSAGVHNTGAGAGFNMFQNNTFNYITGLIVVGDNASDCLGAAGRGLLNGCLPDGASDFTLSGGATLTNSFVGRLNVNDSVNATPATAGVAAATPADWLHYENRYRSWARDGGDMGDVANQGFCNTGCRMWDYSLRAGDTVLRNRLAVPSGNDILFHRWDAANQAVCQTIAGAVWEDQVCNRPGYFSAGACSAAGGTWSTGLCTTRVLRRAQEIFFDGVGNENGLCETGEDCLYTPNLGPYQGHGEIVPLAEIVNGEVSGVRLYQHSVNGY